MGAFADSIGKNILKINTEVNDKITFVAQDLFTGIIKDTPVGSPPRDNHPGLLKNNWFTAVNTFSTATTDIQDAGGSGSMLNVDSLKQEDYFFNKDSSLTMSNNLDYSYRAEAIGWRDIGGNTDPYLMVATNLDRVSKENYK